MVAYQRPHTHFSLTVSSCTVPAVYQDDKEMKLKGVRSLVRYAAMSAYMLCPLDTWYLTVETGRVPGWDAFKASLDPTTKAGKWPGKIPGYGSRGWW